MNSLSPPRVLSWPPREILQQRSLSSVSLAEVLEKSDEIFLLVTVWSLGEFA